MKTANTHKRSGRPEKRRNKKYVPGKHKARTALPTVADTMCVFWRVDQLFEQILTTGQADCAGDTFVMKDIDGDWYELTGAMVGWIDLWANMQPRFGYQLDLAPLQKLVNQLDYGMPTTRRAVQEAYDVINRCREIYRTLDVYAVREEVRKEFARIEAGHKSREAAL